MKTSTLYCPTCRRSVEIVESDAPLHGESQATLPDAETTCLQADGQCGDEQCPVTGFSAITMRVRLEHGREQGQIEPVHPMHADFLE